MFFFPFPLYLECFQLVHEGVSDGLNLGGDDREDGSVDPVEFIKATPGSTLGEAGEDFTHGLRKRARGLRRDVHGDSQDCPKGAFAKRATGLCFFFLKNVSLLV